MLTLDVPSSELYDEEHNEFIEIPGRTIKLEHSLISLSKWESKWNIPFLDDTVNSKTPEQLIDYIKCMTIGPLQEDAFYYTIPSDVINTITKYIGDPMTATSFSSDKNKKIGGSGSSHRGTKLTSEVIYYDMIALGIPFECEKWHLNRLFTLIRVCSIKNNPNGKKMTKNQVMRRNSALNAQRKAKLHTKG